MNANINKQRRYMAVIVALLLLAFGLRVFALDVRPLWWDEGLTLTFSRLPPAANIAFAAATSDANPPVYRWAVGGLTGLLGVTPFTSRLLSVFAGTIAAAAVYALVRRLFNRQIAGWTLLLFALAPLQIYHAQEAKGYVFEAAAVLVGALFWTKLHAWALRRRPIEVVVAPWPYWVGFAFTIPLAVGANYLAILALIVENTYSAVLTVRAYRMGVSRSSLARHWLRWLGVQAAGVLLIIPFALATIPSTTAALDDTSAGQIVYSPLGFVSRFLAVFVTGEFDAGLLNPILTIIIIVLAVIGLFAYRSNSKQAAMWITAGWLAVPLLLGYFFHLRYPWFFPRFLLFAQPALLALAAVGITALIALITRFAPSWKRTGILLLGILLIVIFSPFLNLIYDAPPRNDEDVVWPELFASALPYVRDDDLIIARMPWQPGYMYSYLDVNPPPDWTLGFFDEPNIDAELGPLFEDFDRLWQIDYGVNPFQPPVDSVRWMQGRAALAYSEQHGPATMSLFIDSSALKASGSASSRIEEFENGLRLQVAPVEQVARQGDVVGVNLFWSPSRPLDARLVRFLHLTDADGRLVAQIDSPPAMGASMSYDWAPGDQIADPTALLIPLNIQPGEYELWAGLYDGDTLERVPLVQGVDQVQAGRVVVRAAADDG